MRSCFWYCGGCERCCRISCWNHLRYCLTILRMTLKCSLNKWGVNVSDGLKLDWFLLYRVSSHQFHSRNFWSRNLIYQRTPKLTQRMSELSDPGYSDNLCVMSGLNQRSFQKYVKRCFELFQKTRELSCRNPKQARWFLKRCILNESMTSRSCGCRDNLTCSKWTLKAPRVNIYRACERGCKSLRKCSQWYDQYILREAWETIYHNKRNLKKNNVNFWMSWMIVRFLMRWMKWKMKKFNIFWKQSKCWLAQRDDWICKRNEKNSTGQIQGSW